MADAPRRAAACMLTGCTGAVSHGHRLCPSHYAALPGRMRSQLSLVARNRRSNVTDEIWDRARVELERTA